MKAASTIMLLVPLCVLAGCQHKVQATQPPAPQVYPPSAVASNAPPPQLPPPATPDVKQPQSEKTQQPPPPKPKKPARRKSKTDAAQTQTAKDASTQATTQQASTAEPPEMSPIGQLSSTGEHSGVLSKHDIQQQIYTTGNGLKGIEGSLTSDEQKLTATQIKTFLTKAQQALDQGDLDGANTLATKAKVLLSELTKS